MAFKDNILLKIKMDRLAENVYRSLKPMSEKPTKIHRESMEELLALNGYTYTSERFMDIYTKTQPNGDTWILVLDNELPLYNTSMEDVLLRKNPTLKEMISIKNAIKILKDSDVIISKKDDTVNHLYHAVIGPLDLSYTAQDISAVAKDGIDAWREWATEEVLRCIDIFSEVLSLTTLTRPFTMDKCLFKGRINTEELTKFFEYILIYDSLRNQLMLFDQPVEEKDEKAIQAVLDMAMGKRKCNVEGQDVFQYLETKAIEQLSA